MSVNGIQREFVNIVEPKNIDKSLSNLNAFPLLLDAVESSFQVEPERDFLEGRAIRWITV